LRRGLRNQLLCAVIAVLIWLMTPGARGNLYTAWVYSAAIGTGCWFFIDGGRLLLASWLPAATAIGGTPCSRRPSSRIVWHIQRTSSPCWDS
jgi:hypothetical protein